MNMANIIQIYTNITIKYDSNCEKKLLLLVFAFNLASSYKNTCFDNNLGFT